MFKVILNFLVLFTLMTTALIVAAQQKVISISVEQDVYDNYLASFGYVSPLTITNFSGAKSHRDVVEFILVQQAIALGGSDIRFNIITGNYDARNLKMLQSGLLLLSFDSIWHSAANTIDNVYVSDAIIRKGEYFAGIYTSADNIHKYPTDINFSIENYSVVSSRDWHTDWLTLTALKPKQLHHEEDWIGMARMVDKGWVDFMLAPFTVEETHIYSGENYRLQALNNLKVLLNDSRHILVSKAHPDGEEVFKALQKGLKILRQRGVIEKAYRQSGFFNSQTADWRVINPIN